MKTAFAEVDPLICYSVKANSNLGILKVMAEHGSGFDVVSAGELYRVQLAGGEPDKTVFAGVGKTDEEIRAGLEAGVLMFNVESEAELDAIARVAASIGKVAPIALRVNPDVDPKTHRYISTGKKESKFGMDIERAERVAEAAVTISFDPHDRHAHAHRLADHDDRALRRRGRQGGRADRPVAQTGSSDRLVQHGGRLWDQLQRPRGPAGRGVRPGDRAGDQGRELPAGDRTGAGDRRECGHPGQPCVIYQAVGREAVPDPGRRHERSDPAGALRVVPPDLAGGRSRGVAAGAG